MRLPDTSPHLHAGARDAAHGDDAHAATEFGERLRSAAGRTDTPADAPHARTASMHTRDGATPHQESPAAQRMPQTTPRQNDAPSATRTSHSQTPRDSGPAEPHDARPRVRSPSHDHASRRDTRKRGDDTRPPEGIALQTLLAAAHPLLESPPDGASVAAQTMPALTPHDVAASVTQAWLREPSTQDGTGVAADAQWTFTLGDPLTPLAALRISGDATAGWGLQLTAGNGLPARELAAHADRLRRRLRARGQAVDRLEVDDDTPR